MQESVEPSTSIARKIYGPLQLPYEYDRDEEPVFGFRGDFHFLSNFHVTPIVMPGAIILPSSEHAYMLEKDSDPAYKKKIREAKTPSQAKRIGYTAKLPEGWDEALKFIAMHQALRWKFIDRRMAELLLATGLRYLEETNQHGDVIWGRCNGIGANHLGRQLMVIRYLLQMGTLKLRN